MTIRAPVRCSRAPNSNGVRASRSRSLGRRAAGGLVGLAFGVALLTRQARSFAEPPLQVAIAGADTLSCSAHTSIPVIVTLPKESAAMPLALTPRVDGAAIELVRGRLLRSDAKRDAEGRLHFAVPIVARSEGTAIFRVELMAYACDPECRRVDTTSSRVLRVVR